MPTRRRVLAALACCFLLACGGGRPAGPPACQRDRDCPVGQGCSSGTCVALPCGGACQPDEACGSNGLCSKAQGATCADHTCPSAYPCNGTVCAKGCTLNSDCDPGSVCNSQLHSCAQCTFNNDCAGVAGKTKCDSASGTCVACQANIDCTTTVGPDHICVSHACVPGCQADSDCNAGNGEKCSGATQTTPGRCIQCSSNNDCSVGAPACDDTGHCVGCFGTTQTAANAFCGPGSPECDLPSKTCVACLPANNASGLDCGYQGTTPPDPHYAKTCNPATHSCVPGCASDAQCGCPRTAAGGTESNCPRFPDKEHCDPAKTTMDGASSLGACVQCRPATNSDCAYKVHGTTLYGGAYGTFNGSRCVSDTCVEGCDTNADCPGNRICHLGGSSDPNNHKCVECACDVPGTDPSYCEVNKDGSPACAADSHGNQKVCDAGTLSCRHRRQNETCSTSGQCGDATDPTDRCDPLIANPPGSNTYTGFCVFSSHAEPNNTGQTYCASNHALGKCGDPCNDFQQNQCTAGIPCPSGSACRAATNETSLSNSVCVSQNCSYQ